MHTDIQYDFSDSERSYTELNKDLEKHLQDQKIFLANHKIVKSLQRDQVKEAEERKKRNEVDMKTSIAREGPGQRDINKDPYIQPEKKKNIPSMHKIGQTMQKHSNVHYFKNDSFN